MQDITGRRRFVNEKKGTVPNIGPLSLEDSGFIRASPSRSLPKRAPQARKPNKKWVESAYSVYRGSRWYGDVWPAQDPNAALDTSWRCAADTLVPLNKVKENEGEMQVGRKKGTKNATKHGSHVNRKLQNKQYWLSQSGIVLRAVLSCLQRLKRACTMLR